MARNKRSLTERLVQRIYYKYFARNLLYELQLRARSSSADYVEAHMADAVIFGRHAEMLAYAIEISPAEGLCMEFGVATGNTISALAAALGPDRVIHGFDSFEGLPENWGGHVERRGAFGRKGAAPRVPGNVVLHQGWFEDTVPAFAAVHPDPAAFIHMDADLYSSTRTVLEALSDRIVPGTVILFDEYFNYPNWQNHEFKAWQEFTAARGLNYDYVALTAQEGRVLVRVR